MNTEIIRLSLTPTEGLLIGTFLDGAMEQYEAASIEERQDADLQAMYEMCKRIRPFLPKVNGNG
jgi:hypothetical protein